MKAIFIVRACTLLMGALLLSQCSMPTAESWRYIQTNGLLTYWNQAMRPSSPPFGMHRSRLHYAGSGRSHLRPDVRSMVMRNPEKPNRIPYRPSSRYSNAPTPAPQRSSAPAAAKPSVVTRQSSPPKITIPIEEPSAPQLRLNTAAEITPPAPSQPKTAELPYGTAVPGRVNMVNSPYAGKTQLVDVSGMNAGQTVKCPYTGKLFKVPPTAQASSTTTPPLPVTEEDRKP